MAITVTAVSCTANTWTKAITNQTRCAVAQKEGCQFSYTAVATSGSAPTDQTTAIPFPLSGYVSLESDSGGIDVYVMSHGEAGKVVAYSGIVRY